MFKRYMFIEGLTNLIGSNGKYLINNDGQIKDIKGNDIPVTRDSEGHKVVSCLGWAGRFRLGVSPEPWPTTDLPSQ